LGNIYVVEDDASVRSGMTEALAVAGYRVHAFESAEAFLKGMVPLSPAVLLLDMRLAGMSGVALQDRLRELGIMTPIVFISGESLPHEIVVALKQGAVDFLIKPFSMTALLDALQAALDKDGRMHQLLVRRRRIKERLATLTPREREVLGLMLKGYSNAELAAALEAAVPTTKIHRSRVMRKLQVQTYRELVELCSGLLDGEA
jgi:FixJ family two-component response regulator